MLGERLHDGGGPPARAVVASRCRQGDESLGDVFGHLGRGVLGACRPFLDPGGIGGIIALSPLIEPAFRTAQVLTDVLDLVVGTIGVESLVTTVWGTLGHRRCLDQRRFSCAELVLLSVHFVLDVLAHAISCVQITPGVDESRPVRAAHLETRAPVYTGAGVGVESKGWLRDHALDASDAFTDAGVPTFTQQRTTHEKD